jgi:L,D-transpeptidase-like protein
MIFRSAVLACVLLASMGFDLFGATQGPVYPRAIISVRDQKLMVVENNERVAVYPVSTSKFGLGDRWGSMATPLGWLQVAEKIGDHAPPGAVFHKRRFTGEILQPNAPGRDPIVTRIIWLRGLEPSNANAFNRCIYIHGTAEEKSIGKPSSYGCVRMCSKDVTEVYSQLPVGSVVRIIPDSLPKLPKSKSSPLNPPNPGNVIFTADAPAGKASAPMANSAAEKKPTAQRHGVSAAFARLFGSGV